MRQIILRKFLFVIFLTGSTWHSLGQTNINSIKYIKYGTSFGMCIGYCFNETKFVNTQITTCSKSWGKGRNNTEPDKLDTVKIDTDRWKKLINSVNLSEFYKIPKVLGCPDCADGGAEWIEIGTTDRVYKVEFEYGKQIKAIENLLVLLRSKD